MNVDTHNEVFFAEPEIRAHREQIVREREQRRLARIEARRVRLAKVVEVAVEVALLVCVVAVVRSWTGL